LVAAAALPFGGAAAPLPIATRHQRALADAGTCWLLIRLARVLERPPAGILAALVWAVAPMSVTFAVGGMETSVFVLLTTATLYFHSLRRPAEAATFAGLSLITRPDALIFIGLLVAERARQAWRGRRADGTYPPIRAAEVAGFFAPIALWAVFAWLNYGSPIPNSIVAKSSAYHLPAEAALVRLLQHFATPFLEHLVFGTIWVAIGLVVYLVLDALGAVDAIRRRLDTWPLFAYPPAYFLAFAVGNPLIFRWYLTPPLPMFFLGVFLGMWRLAGDLRRPWLARAFGAAAVVLSLNGWTLRPDTGSTRPAPAMAFVGLENLYEDLGQRLRPIVLPDEVVAAGDIGALGYTSGARILDMVGLVSPQVVPFYPLEDSAYVINYAISAEAIRQLQPDWVVLLEVYGRETLLKDPQFLHAYSLVETVPTDLYGSRGLLVYHRMKAP
jgi:hypothetical protein